MKAIICGSGRLLYFLGRSFVNKGYSVTLIVNGDEEAAYLARKINATVLCGDGSNPSVIEDAGANDADVLIAALPTDHDNLAACQIATVRFAVPRTLALVNDPDNEEIFAKLGVSAVSATRIMIDVLEQRAEHAEISKLLPFGEGKFSLAEVVVGPRAHVARMAVKDLGLPAASLLVSVLRGDEAIVPHGLTVLEAGDRVLIITTPESHGEALRVLTREDR